MKRLAVLIVVGLVVGAMAAPVGAAPKPKLPKITGGGQAANTNYLPPIFNPPALVTQFGFTAQATADGTPSPAGPLRWASTVYPAKGQFQGRNYDPATNTTVFQGHGEVVCVANYGPADSVDGDGDPAGTVWEIRVFGQHPVTGQPGYVSVMVQDNGKVDYMDESGANPSDPACGKVYFFGLEPVTQGNIQAQ